MTACASHLLVDLPLFGGPVMLLLVGMLITARGERRRASQRSGADGGGAPGAGYQLLECRGELGRDGRPRVVL